VLPHGAGYETLAGFVLMSLGFIPRGGESFVYDSRRYTVLEVEGRRVVKIRIETLPQAGRQTEIRSQEPAVKGQKVD
jgi:putative hemolysin